MWQKWEGVLFWYLVTTKLKSELRVKENLSLRHNLEVFFPHFPAKKASSPIGLPLFPRYVFVYCDRDRDFGNIQYTPGVSRIVMFGETVIPVPDEVIKYLKERCGVNDEILPANLNRGQKVRIKGGIFSGCEGIIREKRGNKRIQLLLELAYGNELKIEIGASDVELSAVSD